MDEPNTSGSLGDVSTPAQPTSYEYDPLNNLIHVTQDSQNRYFKYDSLSRLTYERQVEQDAPWTTSDYVAGNNQWSRKIIYNSQGLVQDAYDARQVKTHFDYDGLNRVEEIHYYQSNGSADPATPAAFYYYDSQTLPSGAPAFDRGYAAGRLVAMTYGTASSTTAGNYFGYDKMGRVLTQRQVTDSATYGMSYSYNYGGALIGETYPSGRAMSFSYDEAARPSQLSDGTTNFANGLAYAPHGGVLSETLGNGMVQSFSYNRRLQPNEIKLKQNTSGAELQRFNYSYGQVSQDDGGIDTSKNNGQIGRIDGYIGGTKQWDERMTYDSLGRLSTAAEYRGDTGAQTYQAHYDFDRFGNRYQYQSNSNVAYTPVQTSDVNTARNRLIETGTTATTYDPAGNILTDAKFRGMNYQYDANGRQTFSNRTDGTDGQSSVYDCGGQRVQTSANGVTRAMVYDIFGQLLADYLVSSGNALERENIYRGGQLLAVYETGASCYKSISDFVDYFYSSVLGRSYNSVSDPDWKTTLTQAQARGQGQLIAAAQSLGTALFTSSDYANHNPDTPANRGQFVTDLYAGYLGRVPDGYGYDAWVAALNSGSSREEVRHGFAYSQEFQNDAGQLCATMTNSGINYVLQDLQGSTRAVMNNGTYGSSTVSARHDYLPFGEEIWSGTGMRSSSQSYGTTDRNRQKYGMTERDDATGLDHTWWRKYESAAGRWTSPDPAGSTPNAYSYSGNDPVNSIDPSGLMPCEPGNYSVECGFSGWGGGYWGGNGWGMDPHPGQDIVTRNFLADVRYIEFRWSWYDEQNSIIHFYTLSPFAHNALDSTPFGGNTSIRVRRNRAVQLGIDASVKLPPGRKQPAEDPCVSSPYVNFSLSGGAYLAGGSISLLASNRGFYLQLGGGAMSPSNPRISKFGVNPAIRVSRSGITPGWGKTMDFTYYARNYDSEGNLVSQEGGFVGMPSASYLSTYTFRILNHGGCPK